MHTGAWVRRCAGFVIGLAPAAVMLVLPSGSQHGQCVQTWFLYAAFMGAVPWFVVFLGGVSTLLQEHALPTSRDVAAGALVGTLVLLATVVYAFAAGINPPGVYDTYHCAASAADR